VEDENNNVNAAESDDECDENQNCYMCWDYCSWLNKEKKAISKQMCTDEICVSIFQ
jgi:hypothetical protein